MNYNRVWNVMNDVQESFLNINTLEFMCDELQRAVDSGDQQKIVDISHAMTAFLPVYADSFDRKFNTAWNEVVTPLYLNVKDSDKRDVKYEDVCKYFNN